MLDHDCVILPDFGAFIANHAVARMSDKGDDLMLPPYRVVGFNQEVRSNDGLLVQSYMDAYDANYPSAYRQMEMDIEEMVDELDNKGMFVINGVGTLNKDIDGKMSFVPMESGLLTPSLYGLYSFEVCDVEELTRQMEIRQAVEKTISSPVQTTVDSEKVEAAKVAEQSANEEKGDIVIRLHRRWADVAVAAVAAIFFFFIFSYPAMNTPGTSESVTAGAVSVKSTPKVSVPVKKVEEPVKPKEEAPKVEPVKEKSFVIVLASKVSQRNGDALVDNLKKKGFDEAYVVGNEKIRRVVYSSYSTEEEAINARRQLSTQNELFTQSWVMELQ